MKPAAVYLRVSKDDGSQTVANQRPEVMQMASGRGYSVAPEHIYEDQASGGGGREERASLDRLMNDAARGKFGAVFVWSLDRFSRDDSFHGGAMMLGDLDRFNVALLSHQQTWLDTSGPFRTGLVQFALCMAADERKKLIDRTLRGIARAKAEGKHCGRPPVQASAALIDRAALLRSAFSAPSWREVVWTLEKEGFENVPNHATLARLCTKAHPDLRRGKVGWQRSYR